MKVQKHVLAIGLATATVAFGQARQIEVEGWEVRINERQPPLKVIETIGVKPGMVIGEIGAGTGRVTVWLADRVGSTGKVFANDIDSSALEHLRKRCLKEGLNNVTTILGTVDDPRLPAQSLDLAFMTNTYHHLEKPVALVRNILRSLKPSGVLAIVERDRDRSEHKNEATSRQDFVRQMDEAGFDVYQVETYMREDNIYLARPKASPQTDDFLDRLKRIEAFEARNNERQPPDKVMDAVGVKAGMQVGEVGAGRGRYTLHLARRVGNAGKIYANDISATDLAFLRQRCQRDKITNIETVLGEVADPRFPRANLDMIFMVWVYHMVESPVPLLKSFGASLKPGARVVMVEPVPEEIQDELKEATSRGNSEAHVNVLTKASMETYARQAGFRLIETMDRLLEKDIIYVLGKE